MRDATDYYNLLTDTLKNGRNQIKYIYEKIDKAIEKGKYINIRTGCLMKEKDCKDNNYYFHNDYDYPLCYNFSCRGLARNQVIKKIMRFYITCLREYHRTKDEEKMKKLIENEIESARKNYEHLNKNNNGYDDLKLFNIPPHIGEPQEVENSINSSSFINDNSSEIYEKNSFINDGEIEEEKEEYENQNEERNKKKVKLIKNGKNVVNKYKEELDDLLEENYDGEKDLKNDDDNENDNEYILEFDTKGSSFKKKKLCKTKLLNKKIKRNIISDSDEEENEKEEKEQDKEEEINNPNKLFISEEIKNLLKKEEEEESYNNNDNEIKKKKKKEPINKEYYKGLKEQMNLKQGTLDAFLNIKL